MNTRRNFIKSTIGASLLPTLQPTLASLPSNKNQLADESIVGQGEYRYKVDKNWAKISVNSTPLFNCHEMVQDSKGRLIMLGDSTRNNILIFDKSGKLLDSWGTAFPGGHGLTLAKEGGDDALFIVDCGWYQDRAGNWKQQAGQVVKTDLTGRVLFTIGHPRTIGIYKDSDPFMPTETAINPANGDIYVADGYGSDYIIQYNSRGQYIRHFGGHANANPDHNLKNAHGVAIDTRDKAHPTLICTSRDETCFKVFTLDGKFLKKIDLPGMYVCRPVLDGQQLYAGVCWSNDAAGKRNANSGFLTILDGDNKVVSSPGGQAPVYRNGVLQPTLQMANPVFQHGHDVCVDEDKNLYVCQWNANFTPPVKLTRV